MKQWKMEWVKKAIKALYSNHTSPSRRVKVADMERQLRAAAIETVNKVHQEREAQMAEKARPDIRMEFHRTPKADDSTNRLVNEVVSAVDALYQLINLSGRQTGTKLLFRFRTLKSDLKPEPIVYRFCFWPAEGEADADYLDRCVWVAHDTVIGYLVKRQSGGKVEPSLLHTLLTLKLHSYGVPTDAIQAHGCALIQRRMDRVMDPSLKRFRLAVTCLANSPFPTAGNKNKSGKNNEPGLEDTPKMPDNVTLCPKEGSTPWIPMVSGEEAVRIDIIPTASDGLFRITTSAGQVHHIRCDEESVQQIKLNIRQIKGRYVRIRLQGGAELLATLVALPELPSNRLSSHEPGRCSYIEPASYAKNKQNTNLKHETGGVSE